MSTIVLTAEQLTCLASPARNEVFMQLRIAGQASVGELARAIGRKPEAVHYHVKALERAGLAKEVFKRPATKKPESVYEPVGRELRLPKPDSGPENAALIRKAVQAGFRQSVRGYLKAAQAAETDRSLRPKMHVIRMNIRLKSEDIAEFLQRVESVVRFADENRDEAGEKVVWSSLVYPADVKLKS